VEKNNISYGLPVDVTMESVQHAAGLANAHQFIIEMEKQYETEAGIHIHTYKIL
jgi:ABC-type multidrug transport system fused ATPase/permease subunit